MRDIVVMEILYRLGDLLDDDRGLFLGQDAVFLEEGVERALVHVLEDDEEMGRVVEEAVHAEDVLMVEAALKANLEAQLVDHQVGSYHRLRDLLNGQVASNLLVSPRHHHPELSFAQSLPYLKILQPDLPAFLLGVRWLHKLVGRRTRVRVVSRGR